MISNHTLAVEKAFLHLSQIETISLLSEVEKSSLGFESEFEIWKVETEVSQNHSYGTGVIFYIEINKDFPLSFPRIYLGEDDYNRFKYIPHIDTNKFICTFDSDLARPIPDYVEGIIPACLQRAKQIIYEGINGLNSKDFEEEFLSYWGGSYSINDKVQNNVLCLINSSETISNPSIIHLSKRVKSYEYVVHNNDLRWTQFEAFLKGKKIEFTESEAFYFKSEYEDFDLPFDYTNGDILKILSKSGSEIVNNFKQFINSDSYIKFVLTQLSVSNKTVLIGWFYKKFQLTRNGFRNGGITKFYAMSDLQRNDKINRVELEILTNERLTNRTAGNTSKTNQTFLIAGLGSIGSNLAYLLNSMNYPAFKFIDYDYLKIENIGRHHLGFSSIGQYKSLALKDYFQSLNPLHTIDSKEDSIVSVMQTEIDYINSPDFIFLATGNTNVERFIGDKISEGVINRPCFFIWVEPFLAAGHCLYIHPKSLSYSSFFTSLDLFKFNIINSQHYDSNDNNLTMKEAGCQTTYVPYSSSNVLSFLGSIFPKISYIIENNVTDSKSYTWIGNIETLNKKGILLSPIANNKKSGDLIENVNE